MANVPRVPGVPILAAFAETAFTLIVADLVRFLGLIPIAPQWGIYLDGIPVIAADNTISFEFKRDFPISNYPQEQGAFQSYNKVQLPADIRVRVSAGGNVSNRQAFLQSIAAQMSTTDLYDIVTPEKVYTGYNFTHQDFHRSSKNGVGLIAVDLWLTEVRLTSTATFANTQQPGVAGPQAIGNVQPQTPSDRVSQGFAAFGGVQ